MKLKDLFKYVESENKFNEFMSGNGYKEVNYVGLNDRAFRGEEFTNVKDLVKVINEEYYANISSDTELTNRDGYIEMTFEQSIPDYKLVDGKVVKEETKQNMTISLFVDTKQVWG